MKKRNKKILVIIPARGGSKGISRKNIQPLNGKPLIAYTLGVALKSKYIDRVVVSTEDEEIAEIARLYGAKIIKRPEELAQDATPLDPVIYHALDSIEKKENTKYNLIITIQLTSPLLTLKTLNRAIEIISKENYDTLISVKDETHLYWTKKDKKFTPLYKERKNRQYLDPIYQETGTLLISKRKNLTPTSRLGKRIFLFEIPKEEAMDIDNNQDWWIAENLLKRMKIVFRVDADKKIGIGHIYRALTLANRLSFNHKIFFLMDKEKYLGIKKVKTHNYPIITFKNEEELFKKLKKISPDMVINDILDTDKKYIHKLKKEQYFVINFEDLNEGAESADLVINALYEKAYPSENHYFGHKYVCLRDEFRIFPRKKIKKEVKQILISFGGPDINNLTVRTLKAIGKLNLKNILIKVILGLGHLQKEELYNYVNYLRNKGFTINVKEDIKMMAKEIYDADIAITANGRTIYEIASIGVPCISISQNEREVRHLFTHNSKAVIDLGIAFNVSEEYIALALKKLIKNYRLRKEMANKFLEFDLKNGLNKTLRLIFDKYYEWKENKNK